VRRSNVDRSLASGSLVTAASNAFLINNAGALFGKRQLTEDGLEYTFALNHMSYFVVTEGLRERLLASGAGRIISTASAAHRAPLWISTIFNSRRALEE
jgi:NAD(P)-dependent dehydrogenase (short-subunit alcohol dehydrogenase family)